MKLILLVACLVLATTTTNAQLSSFVSPFSQFDSVAYHSCGNPLCPSTPAYPPAGYRCNCNLPTEHPDCGCANSCDCSQAETHPACGCITSIPYLSSSQTCVSGPCGGLSDFALPFTPSTTEQLPLPVMQQIECRPNVAGIGPGTCRRGTDNDYCGTESNCAQAAACNTAGSSCYPPAVEQSCACHEAAPAPCECQQQQQLQQLLQQFNPLALQPQQPQQIMQPQQPYNPCAATTNPCGVPSCSYMCPQQQQPIQQQPVQPAPQVIQPAPQVVQPQPQVAAAQEKVEQATGATAAAETPEQKSEANALEQAKDAAVKAREAVLKESENLQKQQEMLRNETKHLEELSNKIEEQKKELEQKKSDFKTVSTEETTQETKISSEQKEVIDIEGKAQAILQDIQHQAQLAGAKVDGSHPEQSSKIQFDQAQLAQLQATIDRLGQETQHISQEHLQLKEQLEKQHQQQQQQTSQSQYSSQYSQHSTRVSVHH